MPIICRITFREDTKSCREQYEWQQQTNKTSHRLASNIDRVGWPSGDGALDTNPSFPPEYLLPFPWVPVLASTY